jgi:membrane protein DedA with SNARE-associated domain
MAFLPFVIGSAIGRGTRFYLVAFFVKLFGEKIDYMLKKYMDRIGWAVLIIITICLLIFI